MAEKKHGCLDGCHYKKDIKIKEMQGTYAFRCSFIGRYMTPEDVKKWCKDFSDGYEVHPLTLDQFFEE